MEQSTYRIKTSDRPDSLKCLVCGHSLAAHGSNGLICCACKCTRFIEPHDSTRPVASKI